MRRKRLFWRIFSSFVFVTIVTVGVLVWIFTRSIHKLSQQTSEANLRSHAGLVRDPIRAALADDASAGVEELCRDLGSRSGLRITVVGPDGRVLADSEEDPDQMDNHVSRPEVVAALASGSGVSMRYSHSLQSEVMYLAEAVQSDEGLIGVIRVAASVASPDQAISALYWGMSLMAAAALGLSLTASLWLTRRLRKPLKQMAEGADRFARREFGEKLSVPDTLELAQLAEAFNAMAEQLETGIGDIIGRHREHEAVLSSMVEGVLAVDTDERVIGINRAAAELMGVDPTRVKGRSIQEVVRNVDLQRFVLDTLQSGEAVEGDLVFHGDSRRFLQAHGAPLHDSQGEVIGALVVLNDVTRLRRLESIRRDFVANVSHELKTPITSIQGSVETLLEGAVNEPEHAVRFLKIMARQAERLHTIIEDLLNLSRIEQESESGGIERDRELIEPILRAAVQACEAKANAKQIPIEIACSNELSSRVNRTLIETAIVNLIDNAIKYSEPGSPVSVQGEADNGRTVIRVRDRGSGIDASHLPRLFERFYRVDKSRSRKLGGTGLGLAIVKHIAQAHEGKVEVQSILGEGSTFSLYLPQA